MISADDLLSRFDRVERQRDGDWLVRCPCHDDHRPSLHVTLTEDRWLLHCLAGCPFEDVCAHARLSPEDLGPEARRNVSEPTAVYLYIDEQSRPLFEVGRFPGKKFLQRRPGREDWKGGIGDVRRVLYRLPKVLAAVQTSETVYVVEGEEDVHALERAGKTATCNPMGAGKWRPEHTEALRGASVIVVADRDDTGRDHARTVTQSLAGVAARVWTVEAAEGKDARDHLTSGKTVDELVPVDLNATAPTAGNASPNGTEPNAEAVPEPIEVVSIEVVSIEEFAAVDEPGADALLGTPDDALIPTNGDIMVYGDGGAGKTTLTIDLACHLGSGTEWLGIPVPNPARVLIIEREGPRPLLRAKLRRKLDGWNGKPTGGRVQILQAPWARFTFATEAWREALAQIVTEEQTDVIIAGPLTRLGMNTAGTLQEVVAFMELIDDVRQRCQHPLAVILVHHENKGGAVSGAWEGAGDTLLHVQAAGHGHTIAYIQKARWASTHHAETWHLAWTDGESYEREDKRDLMALAHKLFTDRKHRTIDEIRQALQTAQTTIRDLIADHPNDWHGPITGNDAKALGAHPNAKLYITVTTPVT